MRSEQHIQIAPRIYILPHELVFTAIRAQGPGGQNVNKVSSAIHLSFDVLASDLPTFIKDRLLKMRDQRLSKDGVISLKCQEFRSQEQNRMAALERMRELLNMASKVPVIRKATKVSKSSVRQRLDSKSRRGEVKSLRRKLEG